MGKPLHNARITKDKEGNDSRIELYKQCDPDRAWLPLLVDVSDPFCKDLSVLEYLSDDSILALLADYKYSFRGSDESDRTIINMFVQEFGGVRNRGEVGAIWFSGETPTLEQFNKVKDDWGMILAWDKEISDIFWKLSQKNIPSSQAFHLASGDLMKKFENVAKDPIAGDAVHMVFAPEPIDRVVTNALNETNCMVMVLENGEFVRHGIQ